MGRSSLLSLAGRQYQRPLHEIKQRQARGRSRFPHAHRSEIFQKIRHMVGTVLVDLSAADG
jgi:hypothetical protein